MRLVIQRVSKASVKTGDRIVGKIGKGYLVLVGIKEGDSEREADVLAEKLAKLRVMSDKQGKMNLSLTDVGAKALVISQFTLYGDTSRGNRPSFIKAAVPELAERLYKYLVGRLVKLGVEVETGQFGEYMDINAKLDGPVTILLET